jgi:hypothetical protein
MLEDNFTGTYFSDIIVQYTHLDPLSTGALLADNETNLEDISICRASNYNATEYETPSLECQEFNNSHCDDNDYIVLSNETDSNITDFCLPDDYYCTVMSDDLCTNDTWDELENVCRNTPVTCPESQSCDPMDG